MNADDLWGRLFNFQDYGALLELVQNSIIAGAVLGIVGGLIGFSAAGHAQAQIRTARPSAASVRRPMP